jgi:hypothetical protein
MPEICRFFGIRIRMYFGDHAPPHFHANYEGNDCVVDIHTLAVIHGSLSPRAMGMVMEWATIHQEELMNAFDRAQNNEDPGRMEPLE